MLLHLNFESDIPIYQQIRNQIVMGIADGKLPAVKNCRRFELCQKNAVLI